MASAYCSLVWATGVWYMLRIYSLSRRTFRVPSPRATRDSPNLPSHPLYLNKLLLDKSGPLMQKLIPSPQFYPHPLRSRQYRASGTQYHCIFYIYSY